MAITPPFKSFLKSLITLPAKKDVPFDMDVGEYSFHRNWGFTVYRTAYGEPDSDTYWQALLADTQAQVEAEVKYRTEGQAGQPTADSREVLSHFRLDPRSDAQRLAGLSKQQVCQLYLQDASDESTRSSKT